MSSPDNGTVVEKWEEGHESCGRKSVDLRREASLRRAVKGWRACTTLVNTVPRTHTGQPTVVWNSSPWSSSALF